MIKTIAIALLLLCAATAPAQKISTPLQLSAHIADTVDSLSALVEEWEAKMKDVNLSGSYADLRPERTHLQAYVEQSSKQLARLPDIGGSWRLVEATVGALAFIKGLVPRYLMPIEKFTKQTPDEELGALLDKMDKEMNDSQYISDELAKAQQEYARRNKIPLAEEEEEK